MARNAKRCEREEQQQRQLIKKAIEKGNAELAKIHAANAIRKKNEALNFVRLSARLDAAASQISSAVSMGMVNKTMGGVVAGLEQAVQTENVEQISLMMDKFENQVATLNTQTSYMEGAMNSSSQYTTPTDQVDELIQQVADAHGLEVNLQLRETNVPTSLAITGTSVSNQKDELTERLNALRNRQ